MAGSNTNAMASQALTEEMIHNRRNGLWQPEEPEPFFYGALVCRKQLVIPVSYTHLDVYKRQVL